MTAPNSTAGIFPLDKKGLLEAYRTMKTIREFEERLHADFAKGDIPGFVHLYAGEEAAGTGIMMHLQDKDRIASTHRGHGHCISKGVDPKAMMAEIYAVQLSPPSFVAMAALPFPSWAMALRTRAPSWKASTWRLSGTSLRSL